MMTLATDVTLSLPSELSGSRIVMILFAVAAIVVIRKWSTIKEFLNKKATAVKVPVSNEISTPIVDNKSDSSEEYVVSVGIDMLKHGLSTKNEQLSSTGLSLLSDHVKATFPENKVK